MTKEQIKTEKKYYIRCIQMCSQDAFREPKRGISRERFRMRSYYKSAYKILLNELERSEYSPIITLEKIACDMYYLADHDETYCAMFGVSMWMIDIVNALRGKDERIEDEPEISDDMYIKCLETEWP